jgi:uncharacterized membrane protein YbhN (UPF0104 family)
MGALESPVRDRVAAQSRRAVTTFLIRAALGCGLIGFLLWLYGAQRIVQVLAHERLDLFFAAVALYVAGQIMSSYRWQLLARINGIEGPWREFLAYYFIGMATNLFVPGLIGGDAARATYLGLRHRRMADAIASVVADRGIGLVALFWMAAIAAVTVSSVRLPPSLIFAVTIIGILVMLGFFLATLLIGSARRFTGRIGKLIGPLMPYLGRPTALIPAIILSLILQASLALCQYLLAVGMGLRLPLSAVLLVVPMANVAASLPLTLNGLGVREGAYLLLFGMAGISHQDAVALGLLWFASTMVGGLTGIMPFVFTALPRPDDATTETLAAS